MARGRREVERKVEGWSGRGGGRKEASSSTGTWLKLRVDSIFGSGADADMAIFSRRSKIV